ncbi:MAG: Nif3-like dinuclear metal center hexameric protein [Ruminococcaceae bacterium]|nr:Nif3-like dinuclear metal center hexameric protein [Oscillospiraceae bacterium]
MTVHEIYSALCDYAPLSLALDFDNPGFLVGEENASVTSVLIALDITPQVISEAKEKGAELIVSHHPIIFGAQTKITDETYTGKNIISLVRSGVSAICMHTNLDAAQGGVNDCLAEMIGLSNIETVEDEPMLRIGEIETTSMKDFLSRVADALGADLRYCGENPVQRVGVVGGAAGDLAETAWSHGCDTFITGEVKHHQWLEAQGRNLIEGGHFATEAPVCARLKEYLSKTFPALSVEVAESNQNQTSYFAR